MADVLIISLMTSALLIFSWIWRLLWWKPKKLERYLRQQGLKGPTYRFLVGTLREKFSLSNQAQSKPMDLSHAIVPHVAPFIHRTVKEYGTLLISQVLFFFSKKVQKYTGCSSNYQLITHNLNSWHTAQIVYVSIVFFENKGLFGWLATLNLTGRGYTALTVGQAHTWWQQKSLKCLLI